MFCPQCGQQQVSAQTRFCSKCGLPLNLVAEVVANGGTLPQIEQLYQKNTLLTRSNGLKFGLIWFLVMTFLITPITAVLNLDELIPIVAIVGFMGGILMMIFSALFLTNKPKENYNVNQITVTNSNYLHGNAANNALPPQQSVPASDYVHPPAGSWRSTEDLQPTSVTEETTKLLKEEDIK